MVILVRHMGAGPWYWPFFGALAIALAVLWLFSGGCAGFARVFVLAIFAVDSGDFHFGNFGDCHWFTLIYIKVHLLLRYTL